MKDLKETPLLEEHVRLGGKIVPFAGYAMPVQYPTGIRAEHQAVRETAGLFDVSHMGEFRVRARMRSPSSPMRRRTIPRCWGRETPSTAPCVTRPAA